MKTSPEADEAEAQELLSRLQRSEGRRWSARLRVLMPAIEQAFQQGSSRAQVHDALVTAGIAISFESFKKALYRLRKSTRKQQADAIATPPPSPSPSRSGATTALPDQRPAPTAPGTPTPLAPGSIAQYANRTHNLTELGKIGRLAAARNAAEKKAAESS